MSLELILVIILIIFLLGGFSGRFGGYGYGFGHGGMGVVEIVPGDHSHLAFAWQDLSQWRRVWTPDYRQPAVEREPAMAPGAALPGHPAKIRPGEAAPGGRVQACGRRQFHKPPH